MYYITPWQVHQDSSFKIPECTFVRCSDKSGCGKSPEDLCNRAVVTVFISHAIFFSIIQLKIYKDKIQNEHSDFLFIFLSNVIM